LKSTVITTDPEILAGVPIFCGTRVPVHTLVEYLRCGETLDEFLMDFPTVTRKQAIAALELAEQALVEHAHSA
jgi:uncharacterized protein (DUF433 family)